ncbi:metal-dependent hydrolase [Wohlfahrtiimonas chitiniclastica]|uniref:TatD family hydrolase n=1 Tax=Wohlfahrtiimonas chitiniclastica TaxID=400946 RepID=UPI000B994075|nr:TatD family hydrolase [Wohlfahrtiimonas chitiniclastica]MBS7820692.1 TatD family hydrolase [Wohlfahrtiimonas chitiniclastica]OYQ75073.1 metal-dependent hydrolase [Wohlfahrtiimonas chitiniclastica]OYQ88683.1 metal-dependent hydrolase [Wohlfahrtiimonas chitiniclastica]
MLIDSHCHLDRIDLTTFDHNFAHLMQANREADISHMLCVAVHPDDWQNMADLTAPYENVFLSFGIHPGDIKAKDLDFDVAQFAPFMQDSRVIAVGETGLDYHYGDNPQEQQTLFARQIEVANLHNKPLIIHTRDAREDTIAIMKENHADRCGGVMHCFTENWAMAKAALDLGFYISFSGIVTFNNAQELREVAKKVPLDRLLVETDSPYLTPVPYRGKVNYPARVHHVAQKLADLKEVSFDTMANATTENFKTLFKVLGG